MNDRELLEACARVMGLKIDKSPYNGGGHGNTGFDMLGNAVLDWHNGTKWNPLTSLADAADMAIKCKVDVDWATAGNDVIGVRAWAFNPNADSDFIYFKDHPTEQLAYCAAVCAVVSQMEVK